MSGGGAVLAIVIVLVAIIAIFYGLNAFIS